MERRTKTPFNQVIQAARKDARRMMIHKELTLPAEPSDEEKFAWAYANLQMDSHQDTERAVFWNIYTTTIRNIESHFAPVLPEPNLIELIDTQKKSGKKMTILDVCAGSGNVIRTAIADGVNITLTDQRNENEKAFDDAHNRKMITGDVFQRETWLQVNNWRKKEMNNAGFDIVFCAPFGAIYSFQQDPRLHFLAIQQLWTQVAEDGGLLLTQVPHSLAPFMERWVEQINECDGVAARWAGVNHEEPRYPIPVLSIQRTKNAPHFLPPLR